MAVLRAPNLRDLPDDVAIELVEQMFRSRMNVRWLSAIMLIPTIYGALRSESAWTLPAAIAVWSVSLLRIAIAEAYVLWGDHDRSALVQNRWRLIYLVGGSALAFAYSAFVADAILSGDAWLVACAIAVSIGGAYGAIPYVGLSPMSGLAQTLPYAIGPAITLFASNADIRVWMAASLLAAVLSIKGQSDRTYAATVQALMDRREVLRLATTDPLTDLWNRRHLETVVREALADQIPNLNWLGIDLDRFKTVNDTFGHEAGDLVLRVVSDRLRIAAGKDAFVSRIGGDEFVMLLIGGRTHARDVAERIARSIAEPIILPQGAVRIGASVGATAICATDTIDKIAHRADERMYARKAVMKQAA